MASVRVEFYGIVRQRAGVEQAVVPFDGEQTRLAEVLEELAKQLPALARQCFANRTLLPGFTANVDGKRFVSDPETPLDAGSTLLILSSDAGG